MRFYILTQGFLEKIFNSVFPKIFIVIVIAITIPMASIGLLSIKHSSEHIIKQVGQASESILTEKKDIIEHKIAEVDNLVFQLFSNTVIWEFSMLDDLDPRQYKQMNDVIDVLNAARGSNKIVDSIYLYNDQHDYILADTKYTKSDFPDQDILNYNFDGNIYITPPRKATTTSMATGREVISYMRRYVDVVSRKKMYMVVNIDYRRLFQGIENINNDLFSMFMLVYDDDNTIYYKSSRAETAFEPEMLDKIAGKDRPTMLEKIDKVDYFISRTYSDKLGWNMIYFQTYTNLVQTAVLVRNLIISSLIIVLVFSFALAYIFSIYLYKPISRLVTEVGKHSGQEIPKGNNEFKIIDETVKKLFSQNSELQSQYQMAFPYFQQHSVHDLLMSRVFDTEKFKSIIAHLGVQFVYSRYNTVLIDFENTEITDKIKERVQSYLLSYDTEIIHIMSIIDNHRMVIIINTEMDIETLYNLFCVLKANLNNEDILLTVSLGKPYNSLDKICMSYEEVSQQMNSKFFTGKNEIIYNSGSEAANVKVFYDRSKEEQLINSIKSQNRDEAKRALYDLSGSILENAGSIEYVKYIFFQIVSNVMDTMAKIGISLNEEEMKSSGIFENIRRAETLQELQAFVKSLIDDYIVQVGELKKKQHNDLIQKTAEYVRNNYHRNITLEEISNAVFLSPRYLNSIFKAEEGLTIFEYITKCRMDAAKELLLNDNAKVQDIAEAVGYNNVQSFIRFFKMHYSMTPVEYRRKSL